MHSPSNIYTHHINVYQARFHPLYHTSPFIHLELSRTHHIPLSQFLAYIYSTSGPFLPSLIECLTVKGTRLVVSRRQTTGLSLQHQLLSARPLLGQEAEASLAIRTLSQEATIQQPREARHLVSETASKRVTSPSALPFFRLSVRTTRVRDPRTVWCIGIPQFIVRIDTADRKTPPLDPQ